jgi:hypothetical protein
MENPLSKELVMPSRGIKLRKLNLIVVGFLLLFVNGDIAAPANPAAVASLAAASLIQNVLDTHYDNPNDAFPIMDWSLNQQDPAIAYSSGADNYLVVWTHQWALNANTVINGRLVQADGTPYPDVFSVSQTTNDSSDPSIAYNSVDGEFLVVWEQAQSSGDLNIYARRVDENGDPLLSELVISQAKTYEYSPVVAYNPTLNQYLVVWLMDEDSAKINRIYTQRLDASGALIGSRIEVDSSSYSTKAPHLIYNPASCEYLLAWSGHEVLGLDYNIYAQRLQPDGSKSGGVISVSTWEGFQFNPRLAYNPASNETLAIWQDDHNNKSQIYARRIKADGKLAGSGILLPNQSAMGNTFPNVTYIPMVHGYMVVWEYIFSPDNYDIYQVLLSSTGEVLQPTSVISGFSPSEENPTLAGDAFNGVMFVWEDSRNHASSSIDIYGLRQELPVVNMYLPVIYSRKSME